MMDLLGEVEAAICRASQADRPRGEAALAVFEKWLRERGKLRPQVIDLADELSALRKEAKHDQG